MRISTNTIFDAGVSAISRQQSDLLKTQQQISANRRVLTPADDPIAAARALEVGQADAINSQYGTNAQAASGRLSLTEQTLARVVDVLQSVREKAVAGGGGSLTAADRASLAAAIRGLYQDVIGIANSDDGEGNYLFSGFQTGVQPFAESSGGVQYSGDDGERLVQVSSTRQAVVSESGAEAFMRIRQGNGTFVVSAPTTNAGSATYSIGSVTDPTALTADQYRIVFSVIGTTTTYDVLDTTTGATVTSAQPYTSDQTINFDGVQVKVSGAPANGDEIQVAPSTDQSLFKTIADLAAVLDARASGAAGKAQLSNGLASALANLDQALDHVSGRRSVVGTRMREVDFLQAAGEDLSIQYKQTLSQLQDLDYAKAISDLMRQRTTLEAAQKSFVQTANLSIFNYL